MSAAIEGGGKKQDGDGGNATKPKSNAPESNNNKGKDGEAHAAGGDAPIKPPEFETITLPDGRKVKRLKPNSDYQSNGYNYKTDSDGRIIEVNGTLRQEKGGRSNHHRRTVGKNDGRLDTDHGGHLIGDQFGGSGGKDNLVPMDKDVNNYHKGEWGQMEKNWADELKNGKEVDVKIEPRYEGNSGRPSHFDITETITPPGIPKNITIFN